MNLELHMMQVIGMGCHGMMFVAMVLAIVPEAAHFCGMSMNAFSLAPCCIPTYGNPIYGSAPREKPGECHGIRHFYQG